MKKMKKGSLTQISWKQALTKVTSLINEISSKSKSSSDIVFIGGALLDLESLSFLQKFARALGVKFMKEESAPNNNLLFFNRSNTSLKSLSESDLLLTIGSNPRFEASMYDMKIKGRTRAGLFTRASIGVHSNYTYDNLSLGTSLKTLFEILEGKHTFCKQLVGAKKPVLVLNSEIYKVMDVKTLSLVVKSINKNCSIISDEWFGLDVLSNSPNYLDINDTSFNNVSLNKAKLVYLIGVNNPKAIKDLLHKEAVVIQQAAISDAQIKNSNLILPNTLFVEKDASF